MEVDVRTDCVILLVAQHVSLSKYMIVNGKLWGRSIMAPTILSCSVCGSPVEVLGKTGAMFSTLCPNCGMSSQPMMANYLTSIDKRIEERDHRNVEIVRVNKKRHRVINEPIPSEPPI